jgi:hypothetical protein
MAAIDHFTPVKVLGLGLLLSAANAKNAPLTIAAGASISSAGISVPQQIGALAIFVAIASLGVLAPPAVSLSMGNGPRASLSAGESGPHSTTPPSWPPSSPSSG